MMAAGLVVGLAVMVGAQPPAGGAGMRGRGMGMRQGMGPEGGPMAALKLTPEQHQAIQGIMQAQREASMEKVRELRKRLHKAIYADGNVDAATTLATEIATIEAKNRVQMQMAMKAVLTPEQLKIVLDTGMEFPPAGMGPGGPGGMRGMRGGQPVKK
jgi:Spy/CpxP family protein refolding chaperone